MAAALGRWAGPAFGRLLACLALLHLAQLQAQAEDELMAWMERNSQNHSKIDVKRSKFGKGLFARKSIGKGETIFTIPQKFTIGNSTSNEMLDNSCAMLKKNQKGWKNTVAHLLWEKNRGKKSVFHSYIKQLPTYSEFKTFHPMAAPASVLKDFKAFESVVKAYAHLEYDIRELVTIFDEFSSTVGTRDCFKTPPTYKELHWAALVARSRRFDDDSLVPVMDTINHAAPSKANAYYESISSMIHGTRWREVAKKDIEAGEEITHSYSDELDGADEDLAFLVYGFWGEEVKMRGDEATCESLRPAVDKYLAADESCVPKLPPAGCHFARYVRAICRAPAKPEL